MDRFRSLLLNFELRQPIVQQFLCLKLTCETAIFAEIHNFRVKCTSKQPECVNLLYEIALLNVPDQFTLSPNSNATNDVKWCQL